MKTYFDLFSEQDIDLRIQGRSDSGQSIDIRESTTVASDQTQIVRIRIGDLGQGSYTLISKGKSPIEFDQSQKLEYVHKGYSIFIQTDKAIYRPGDSILCFTNTIPNTDSAPQTILTEFMLLIEVFFQGFSSCCYY
jgi:CD109 antigen